MAQPYPLAGHHHQPQGSLLRSLVDALPHPAVVLGLDDAILASNEGAARLFGWRLDRTGRTNVSEWVARHAPTLNSAIEEVRRGAPAITVGETAGPARRPGPGELIVRGLRDDLGRVAAVLITRPGPADPDAAAALEEVRVLHEELRAQSEGLRRQHDELEAARSAAERKNEFLAMLAHELRNPLSTVVNALHVIRRHAGDSRAIHRAAELGQRQARHTARLLDDLLDVSRIVLDKIQLRLELVDLTDLVRHGREAAQLSVHARAQTLTVAVPDTPLFVHGDPTRLQQCLANLVNNAVKFTPSGGTIHVSARRDHDSVALVVRDSGIGIAPDKLDEIFDLFVQEDVSRARSRGGLGIGLTLARRLIELHGGTLTARSEGPGRGSEFEIRLPPADAVAPLPREDDLPATAPRRRILLVEDDRDSREMLRAALQMAGHTVSDTGDPTAAVRLAVEWAPDVALIDIGLPGMDGYQVAMRIRRRVGDLVRLIALTGYSDVEARRSGVAAGFAKHVVKPVSPDELERVLAAV